MFAITGALQEYAWGTPGGLNTWLPEPLGQQPQAELWFGSHPHGPSPLRDASGTLADVTSADEVPVLAKLLAASSPLSIQVHPHESMARTLFDSGSALVADPYGKHEILVALEPFSIFAGWRDSHEAAEILRATDPSLTQVAQRIEAGDSITAMEDLLSRSPAEVARLIPALHQALTYRVSADEMRAHAIAASHNPDDAGLLVLTLLHHQLLASGTAVYLPTGGVHAYVEGFGLEVMNSSDNVLRLGLTSKQVAVAEATSAISDLGTPVFLGAEVKLDHGNPAHSTFHPQGSPFLVDLVRHAPATAPSGAYRCVLCLGGVTEVVTDEQAITLRQGEAVAILASEADASLVARGTAALITSR